MPTLTSLTTNFFPVAKEGFVTTLSGSISSGAATLPLNSVTGYANGSIAVLVVEPSSSTAKNVVTGVVDTAGVRLTSCVWTEGTTVAHNTGSTVVDYTTATHMAMLTKGLLIQHNQDGTHGSITTTGVVNSGNYSQASGTFAIPNGSLTNRALTFPYKFLVYRNAALSVTSPAVVATYDTKVYDTGSNIDVVTNKGRFTAPIAGFYHFDATLKVTDGVGSGGDNSIQALFYKNGSEVAAGNVSTTRPGKTASSVSETLQLAANDYIEVYGLGSAVLTLDVGATMRNRFSGFFMSPT